MYTTVPMGFIIAWIVLGAFFIIAGFLSQTFMGLAIYHDAKSRRNDNAGMWGVLTGFFSWIPVIIYFCVRNQNKTKLIPCASCGFFLPIVEYECPNCVCTAVLWSRDRGSKKECKRLFYCFNLYVCTDDCNIYYNYCFGGTSNREFGYFR